MKTTQTIIRVAALAICTFLLASFTMRAQYKHTQYCPDNSFDAGGICYEIMTNVEVNRTVKVANLKY
jgi:hypothetical protein